MPNESYLQNVHGKTTIWITERILPFDIPNVDPQIPSIRGCDLSSKLKGSLYSYRPDGFSFQRFVCFRRIRIRGCFWCPWINWLGFPEKSFKFHHSTNFSFKWFSCNFSETLFWITTSPGRWWPWWRCSMLGGGAKSRAGAVDDVSSAIICCKGWNYLEPVIVGFFCQKKPLEGFPLLQPTSVLKECLLMCGKFFNGFLHWPSLWLRSVAKKQRKHQMTGAVWCIKIADHQLTVEESLLIVRKPFSGWRTCGCQHSLSGWL